MNNQVVVFSGFRDDDLKKMVEEKGGKVAASLVKATTMLVYKETKKPGAKVEEAKNRGITIITLEDFKRKLTKSPTPPSPSPPPAPVAKRSMRETYESMSYAALVDWEKQRQEAGLMSKRKGMKKTKEAIIARFVAYDNRK
jgi:BRCT domain type II-containing protein